MGNPYPRSNFCKEVTSRHLRGPGDELVLNAAENAHVSEALKLAIEVRQLVVFATSGCGYVSVCAS